MKCGKRKTVWLVIVLYATTVCAGEGMHLLPGCGHAAHLRGGNLSLDTFLGDHHASEFSHDGRLVHATGTSHSNRDADGCPICKLCLLPVFGGSTAVHISVELISYREIWFSEPKIARNIGSSFLSRASPTV